MTFFSRSTLWLSILSIVFILFIGGVLFLRTESATASGTLRIQPIQFDFGTVSMADGVVETAFTVANPGTTAVRLIQLYTSCMCTTASFIQGNETYGPFGMPGHKGATALGKTIEPGDRATIGVRFDPAAHGPQGVGPIERLIIIETNSTETPRLTFTLRANVIP